MKNNKGFAIIESLLILVIVGILGGTGWYVWNARNKTTDTLTNADAANSSTAKYSQTTKHKTELKHFDELGISMEVLDGWAVNKTSTNEYGNTFYSWEISNPEADGKIFLSSAGFLGGFEGCDQGGSLSLTEFTVHDVAKTGNSKLTFLAYSYISDKKVMPSTLIALADQEFFSPNTNGTNLIKNSNLKAGKYYGCLSDPIPGFSLKLSNRQLQNLSSRDTIYAYDKLATSTTYPPLSFTAKSYSDIKEMLTSIK